MPSQGLPYRIARHELLVEFERIYLLSLLERWGTDLAGAAREAELPVEELAQMVRTHTRPYFLARVRQFYGDKLRQADAERIADELLTLELQSAEGPAPKRAA
jgi:hypothetical protein